MVEYASADAVRRGGGAGPRPKNLKASGGGASEGPARRKKKLGSTVDDRADERDLTTMTTTVATKKSKPQEEKGKASDLRSDAIGKAKVTSGSTRKSRPTPGAALALAKREQVAIVPSQGRRITFDH